MSAVEVRPGLWGRLDRRIHETPAPPKDERGVWRAVRQHLDPAEFRPKLADDIEIKLFNLRWGKDYAMIANPRDLVHYRLELPELETVKLMDGTRTVKEIVVERFRESGDLELAAVAQLVKDLQEAGFLDPPFRNVDEAVKRGLGPKGLARKVRQFTTTLQVEWEGADGPVRWLYQHGFRLLFNPVVVIALGVTGIVGAVAFAGVIRSGNFSLTGQSLALEFVILSVLNYFITLSHELGHALAVIHYGRRIKSAGFMIYYGSPAFFVDASDSLMLDRRPSIIQAAAGPLADFFLAGTASIVALAFPEAAVSQTLYKFAVLNYFVLFMNLIPLLELDGYFILSDVIEVPDLRPRSLGFVRHEFLRKLRIRERFSRQELGLSLYGILGILFAGFSIYAGFFFWKTIFARTIIRMWNGGTLTRALLLILVVLVAGPALRGLTLAVRAAYRRARALWQRIRFRLETSWRVEAATLIDALPLFDELPVDVLNDLAGRVRLRTFARGQSVFRQGDRADAFYVVRRGTLQVVEEDPESGEDRVLRSLGRGESFGELGLLEAAPRAATVRAAEDSEVFEIGKGTFDELLADTARIPEFAPTLQAAAELRALPPFAHLRPEELADLLEQGEWLNLQPGESIIEQGEEGEDFYVIGSGQVEVVQDGQPKTTLGPGSFFGEIALLLDVPRTATVRARTPVRAFRLGREGFDVLMGDAFRRGALSTHAPEGRAGLH